MSIRDHPKFALGALVAVFLFALGLAMVVAPIFNASAPSLSSPSCTNSMSGLTCVGFVLNPSTGGNFSYEMIVAKATDRCGQPQVVYLAVTNVTSGQSYVVYSNQECPLNQ